MVLKSASIENYNDAVVAFRTSCTDAKKEFDLQDKVENGEAAAAEIKAMNPAAVFVVGIKAAMAAKKYLDPSTPLVYAVVLDPEKYGLQGANITGVLMDIPVKTELAAIKGIFPQIRKLGSLYNPKKTQATIDAARKEAAGVGIELVTAKVEDPADTVFSLKSFANGIDALWLIADPTVVNKESIHTVLTYSFENRIPVFAFHKKFVQAGVLLSLSPSYEKMGAQACDMAKKIAGGTPVASVPPEPPRNLEIAVNVKTARSLNLQDISMNAFGFAASQGYKIEALQ